MSAVTVAPAVPVPSPTPASATPPQAWTLRRGGGLDALTLGPRPLAAPVGDEVRVRMRAVALNHRDLMVARGTSGGAAGSLVPASDGAGEVVAVGPDVTGFRVGDRVVTSFFPDWTDGAPTDAATARALGGSLEGVLAEEVVLPQRGWVPMPAHLSYAEAATLPCAGLTAWHALFGVLPARPGERVLLLGTGGVSVWALQLATAAGLEVFVTSSDDAKLARAAALGARATINYRRHPDWEREVLRLTDGQGVDRVLEIGGPDTLARSLAATRMGGTVAVIGRLTGAAPAPLDPATLFLGQKRLAGVMVGSRAMALELARFVERAGIRPVIDRVVPFARAPEAFAHLAAAGHFGKVVVAID
jgi:NADPH:quinone reductase-like Zn-dependent oxidoreductase